MNNSDKKVLDVEEGAEIIEVDEQPAVDVDLEIKDEKTKPSETKGTKEAKVAEVEKPVAPLHKAITEASVGGIALTERAALTRDMIMKEPRIMIILPFENGEKKGAYKSVNINGWRVEIKKGMQVELPESIWNIIAANMKASIDNVQNNSRNIKNQGEDVLKALGMN